MWRTFGNKLDPNTTRLVRKTPLLSPRFANTYFSSMGASGEKTVTFEVLSDGPAGQGEPRLGRLSVKGRQSVDTPCLLAVSSRGVVPHISPDVLLSQTEIGGVHLALEDCEFNSKCGVI